MSPSGGGKTPPHHENEGCLHLQHTPAFETRLRPPEAGFVLSGASNLAGMRPVNVWDYERLAEEKLDANAHAYFAGGAGDEGTLRDNVAAFERRKLRPRMLVDVGTVSTATTVLGTEVALPVLIAPLAMQRMAHAGGEEATARAAAAAGTIMCLSTAATCAPSQLVDGDRWFQVYVWRSRAKTEALIEEAVEAGYSALVLTVDVPYLGRRERDV